MSKLVVLNIVDGDFENGFPVFLEIATEGQYGFAEANGKLPPAPELLKQYKNWQLPYNSLVSNLRSSRIHVAGSTTSIPQIKTASRNLKCSLNDWLNSPQMQSISRTLYQNLNDKSEEIRVIIKTQNSDLQRLPWHLWDDFFQHYLRSEVALSLPVRRQKKIISREKPIILAVFGKREGVGNITEIKLNTDLELLKQHLSTDTDFTPLIEPELEDLYEEIERRPPNLFFFAGHSSSEENGTRGLIELNPDETITIGDLKPALREAVEEGLQLAIFNSCDGLGIARELADLHIPQIIVMREPVPDVVAQKFLQRFLEAFVGERSVNLAVRRARERIHHLEVKYPGVTWLPTVFQNPAEPSLTGNEFRRIATGVEPTQANPTTEASQPENQSQISWMPSVIPSSATPSGTIANPPPSQQPPPNQGFSRICCSQGHENSIANRFCIRCGEALEALSTVLPISNVPPPLPQPLSTEEVNQSHAIAPVGLGSILKGRYRIIRQLGRGGFGQTYLAEDIDRLSTLCVVKQLQLSFRELDHHYHIARRLFHTEAEVLEILGRDDRIPQLLAYFEENQEFYLIQEFIDGEDLSREITLGKQMSESYVIFLLRDVLEILEFVHKRGVIHRDIKPSNLIRRKQDSKLVLIDFGAVKQISNETFNSQEQSVAIGTPGYVPAEQANGEPQFSSDIYALGILCIQALTGVHPKKLSRDPSTNKISWRSQANVSPQLARILYKMVRYDFRQRYQSATEVLQDLQRSATQILSFETILPSPRGTKTIYPHRIWKLIAAFIALIVLAGLAFIIFAPKSSIPNQQLPTSEQEKK
ncbi:protein kinase domain-containing protein [Brasilonema octagenarum]|uniref:non-specific serine/threonine protein kinase n=1 Tax=Brasilonema octagenarum UFV-OR1 TaxID=417115 RepID=A0ABX1MEV1_9CYAN|nr:protein kinase [Brasilonema octagenarum]NMF65429.1 hypothetical protein [Brasilonema octagenarum UFV-OR1]